GGYVLDAYEISYLGTGRDVLRFGALADRGPAPPLVAADPDFDLGSPAPAPPPPPPPPSLWARLFGPRQPEPPRSTLTWAADAAAPTGTLSHSFASRVSRDLERSGVRFQRLPGTRIEGERIARLLGVAPWLGAAVLKAHLKACRSPRILHLSSHGFFLEDQ